MDQGLEITTQERPLWRRVIDFPLVAMIIATMVYMAGIVAAGIVAKFAIRAFPGFTFETRVYSIALPLLIFLYVFVIAKLGEHPRNDYWDSKAVRHLLWGLVGGAAVFSLVVLIAAALGIYRIVGVGDLRGMLAALIGPTLFAAVSEEMLFRGILFRWIENFGGSWTALLLTSLFFGAAHLANPHASAVAAAGIAIEAGVMLGAAYMLTRSLWLPMGLHAAWNFTQGEVYDIPVSGSKADGIVNAQLSGPPLLAGDGFGLEASVIAMVVATAFGLWLLWLAIRRGEVIQPWWVRRRALSATQTAAT
nr:CPBP family intramembrane metalloprotease [Sphingomonas sp.]